MSWTITPQTKVPVDPVFNNVSLLLHGNGANGSTTITDSSPTPKTVTAVGNAQISTAQSKFGGSSIAFDGDGDFISSANNSAFSYGTGDFTVESWIYANAFSSFNIWLDHRANGFSGNGFVILTSSSGVLSLYSGTSFVVSSSALSTGQWYHWAASRSGSTVRLFINGQLASSATFTANLSDSGFVAGKTNESLANYTNGYIDDLRITKGVARYTSNFTPPTAPFPDI